MSLVKILIDTTDSVPMLLDQLHPETNSSSTDSIDRIARWMDGMAIGGFYYNTITEEIGATKSTGTITITNMLAGDTVTVNGVVFTAETSGAVGNQFNLGPAAPGTDAVSGYGVLAHTASLTNTGSTTVIGDIGIDSGSIIGFPPGTFTGTAHTNDASAIAAQTALNTRIVNLQATGPGTTIVGNLAGQTFTPGVYSSASSIDLSVGGTVTLNGAGTYTFLAGSTITFNNGSTVVLMGGATAAMVNWVANSSTTVGTTAVVQGTLLAQVSITINTGASVTGQVLAHTGAVTLASNTLTYTPPMPSPASNAITACNIASALNSSLSLNVSGALLATCSNGVVTMTSDEPGYGANLMTLAISHGGTVSGAFFTGGTNGNVTVLR